MGVKRWDWAALAARAAEFAEKYGLKGDHQAGRPQQPDDNDD